MQASGICACSMQWTRTLGSWFWTLHHSTCLLLVGAVYPICFAGHVRVPRAVSWSTQPRLSVRGLPRISSRVHAIRPFASCELDSCSVSTVPSWQHFYRRVLCTISGSFCAACSCHGQTLPQSATSCSCASSAWCDRFSAHVFASRAFVTVTLAANMRGGMWTQIVFDGKTACTS